MSNAGMHETRYFSLAAKFDLLEASTGKDRAVESEVFNVPSRVSVFVAMLDENPTFLWAGLSRAFCCLNQREAAV